MIQLIAEKSILFNYRIISINYLSLKKSILKMFAEMGKIYWYKTIIFFQHFSKMAIIVPIEE